MKPRTPLGRAKFGEILLVQLLLPLPLLLQLLDLALGHLAAVGQLSREPLGVPLLVLCVALEHLERRHLSLGPLLLVGLLPRFAGYEIGQHSLSWAK